MASATISSIFGPPTKGKRAPSPAAKKLMASIAPPSTADDESGEDEGAETESASMTRDEYDELGSGGTVTITADSGEKFTITLSEAGEDEGIAPEGT